jgi:hypothetical protein
MPTNLAHSIGPIFLVTAWIIEFVGIPIPHLLRINIPMDIFVMIRERILVGLGRFYDPAVRSSSMTHHTPPYIPG